MFLIKNMLALRVEEVSFAHALRCVSHQQWPQAI
jgi:hypothetical protein